jgi:hypothetical protein
MERNSDFLYNFIFSKDKWDKNIINIEEQDKIKEISFSP